LLYGNDCRIKQLKKERAEPVANEHPAFCWRSGGLGDEISLLAPADDFVDEVDPVLGNLGGWATFAVFAKVGTDALKLPS
jgi:hypothetical protein